MQAVAVVTECHPALEAQVAVALAGRLRIIPLLVQPTLEAVAAVVRECHPAGLPAALAS